MSTLYFTDVMHRIIQVIHVSEKPILRMTGSINDHSIMSYALLMYVLMVIRIHLFTSQSVEHLLSNHNVV